jgi:hypothetical protein
MAENKVLRIPGPKEEEVTGKWRKLIICRPTHHHMLLEGSNLGGI